MTKSFLTVMTPILGAIAAYLLNRGTRMRRARTAALEDLQLYERTSTVLGSDDHLADQLKEHARKSILVGRRSLFQRILVQILASASRQRSRPNIRGRAL